MSIRACDVAGAQASSLLPGESTQKTLCSEKSVIHFLCSGYISKITAAASAEKRVNSTHIN